MGSQTIASQTVSGLDISKLKDESALSVPGTRDGEHKFVRVGNAADAYSWSASEGRWVKIGTVVDNPEGKTYLDGKQYDKVVDVAFDEGQPQLKLGFNHGDNPYSVAQEFIWKHDLQQEHLDQIAKFVSDHMGTTTLAAQQPAPAVNANNVDPFTGSAANSK